MKKSYESPRVRALGDLSSLTQGGGYEGSDDTLFCIPGLGCVKYGTTGSG